MRYNSAELAEFAAKPGEHEGRLTHKPPPRTLYDTAYKERWFKLQANFLFYYRLNELGAVVKNEPSGVFVLENCEITREDDADANFGFAIQWKDDPERKHLFFAQSEQSVRIWVHKVVQASYEHLRAELIMLRVRIRRKTGKDPLEQFGTPLPQRASWSKEIHHVKSFQELRLSPQPTEIRASSVPPNASNRYFPKSPKLFKKSPIPPPRRGRRVAAENGFPDDPSHGVGRNKASFKCHVHETDAKEESSFKSHINETKTTESSSDAKKESSFKSHINETKTTESSFRSHIND